MTAGQQRVAPQGKEGKSLLTRALLLWLLLTLWPATSQVCGTKETPPSPHEPSGSPDSKKVW